MTPMKIEIVSDVMCPWCVIGYKNLEQALSKLSSTIDADVSWHPFELNPNMAKTGQDMAEHLAEKYGITPEQSIANRDRIVDMGKNAGFVFNFVEGSRMINSFDCHRMLAFAKEQGKQTELEMALFTAHFTDNKPLDQDAVLLDVVASVGLDRARAEQILNSDELTEQVRGEMAKMHQYGISSVPTFIINEQYAINGGQPADVFVQALTQISEQTAAV